MKGEKPSRRQVPRRRWRPITDADEVQIKRLIAEASDRLTWQGVVELVERELGRRWSRQALEAKEKIKEAYLLRRAGQGPTRVVDATEALLRQRVETLKARVSDLERTLALYDELFLRHHYNAELHGISVAELERPIPKVSKGQTDEEMPEAGRRTGK